nr:hypothetical protein [uncultured Duganella sp.]
MTRFHHLACGVALACAAVLSQAQDNTPPRNAQLQQQEIAKGDPARWYKEDATGAEQARTLRKEIGAALAESTNACKHGPASERDACIREARETYKRDMEKVPHVLAENKRQ